MRLRFRAARTALSSPPLAFICSLLVVGLAERPASGQETPAVPAEQLERKVQSIFDQSCARAGCHAGPTPQQGMNLSPGAFYNSIVEKPSREKPTLLRVHPGKPDSSYLVHKIEGGPDIEGARMPFAGEQLSDQDVATIRSWISSLEEGQEQTVASSEEPAYPFAGWRLHNLPTTRALDRGSTLFLISHRFAPPVSGGYDALYGMDGPSVIKLSLGYAFTDDLLATLGRSNEANDMELGSHYQIAQQGGKAGWPLGLALHGTLNWVSENPPAGESRFRGETLKVTGQVSLARAFGDRFGVLAVPGILFNPAVDVEGEEPLVTLGLGARAKVYRNISVFGEWVPILSGYVRTRSLGNLNRFDSWGGGLQITTGGHVFQIVASNSLGLTTDQYLNGGDLDVGDVLDGEFRLGFNIYRVLNF